MQLMEHVNRGFGHIHLIAKSDQRSTHRYSKSQRFRKLRVGPDSFSYQP